MLRGSVLLRFAFASSLAVVGCDSAVMPTGDAGRPDAGPPDAGPPPAPQAAVDYSGTGFYDSPFPDERWRMADGTVDSSAFPEWRHISLVLQIKAMLVGATGFGRTSGIYFQMRSPLDPSTLPDLPGSVGDGASVFVIDVDEGPERGTRAPMDVEFLPAPGPFGVPNLLVLLPLQGRPLRPNRLYAAVVTRDVHTSDGTALEVAPQTAMILANRKPDGLSDAAFAAHRTAIDALTAEGIDTSRIAATAVFRTGDPIEGLRNARTQVLETAPPALEAPPEAREIFDDFCVFQSTIRMPVFQGGDAPYTTTGGAWVTDASGRLVEQDRMLSNVWITVPRGPMPQNGFPIVVFVRTGGGGDRPLVDRGVQAMTGGDAITPGTGPAMELARVGWAGVSVDGPLGGLRNLGSWDEQFAIFNISNPPGLRDNIRQSALELALFAHVLGSIEVHADVGACTGLSTPAGDGIVRFDPTAVTIMGHSMGAWIAPLAAAFEPTYRAMIVSGAGASWVENVMYKEHPLDVRPIAQALLQYRGVEISEHDPVVNLLQWAGESADPQAYASLLIAEPPEGGPRQVLMFQGMLDHYIPPPIANALTLSVGLDLAGPELDHAYPQYRPLDAVLSFAGRTYLPFAVSGNLMGGTATGVVSQHPEDGVEDGHEIMFQTEPPKRQYRCFLSSLMAGVPRVPDGDGDPSTCD